MLLEVEFVPCVLEEDVPCVPLLLLALRISEAALVAPALDAALAALPLLASRASPNVVILLQLRRFI